MTDQQIRDPGVGRTLEHPDGLSLLEGADDAPAGIGPYRLAARRLRRNKTALVFGSMFLIIVLASLLAPVYANDIAQTGPNVNHLSEILTEGHHQVDVVSATGIPIGPTWHAKFFFGADSNGRDVAVRLLYGGRNSIVIGVVATLVTMVLAIIVGLVSGYAGGWTDAVLSRLMDLIWAYPVLLLAAALGVSLALGGISIGPFHLNGGSILIPSLIIGVVYIPYVARPLRGEVLTLRERDFVDAARALNAGPVRIMLSEILPNLWPTLVVFVSLQLAQSIVLEASLSFLGAGVQAPSASWGTMLAGSVQLITVAPHLTLVPGLTLVAAVLGVNVFGDGLRQALDPRARVRVER